MHHSNNPIRDYNKTEINRDRLEVDAGTFLDLVDYSIENYGFAQIAENSEISNADYRRARSMMPPQYLNARPSDFKWDLYGLDVREERNTVNHFVLDYEKFKAEGYGLYIFSETMGSGKTFLSCCIANGLAEKRDLFFRFVDVPSFLEMLRKKYKGDDVREELGAIAKAELLIMDDIGTEIKKDWVDTEFFRLINSRYNSRKVTIYTSNVKMDSLKLDGRITERINDRSIPVNLPEVSIRAKKAKQKHDEFLKKLGNAL